jgi:hypothetical protein
VATQRPTQNGKRIGVVLYRICVCRSSAHLPFLGKIGSVSTTTPEDLVGILTDVSASWLTPMGRSRVPLPLFLWLTIEGVGTRKLHTPGSGGVAILNEPVPSSYDMAEYGRVVVESGSPQVLGARVGQRIEAVGRLWQEPPGEEAGFVLHFGDGSIAIANLADDLVVGAWPNDAWAEQGVSLLGRP